ncbi:MAG TPA: hypothetical protein VE870_05550 [Bacteroidales bacterium]|nr:hypothetical protein [Bacteroidales bacterium]
MAILNKTQLIQRGVYYTPSAQETVTAGSTHTFSFQGYRGLKYGLNRILISLAGGNLYDFLVSARILYSSGTVSLFPTNPKDSGISADALNDMFLGRSLRGAFIIDEQTSMEIDVQNTSASDQTVNVQIMGYADVQLESLQADYAGQGKTFPRPFFISYPNTSIAAGTTNKQLPITLPRQSLRLYRMFVGSDSPGNLSLKIRQNTIYIKPQVLASQLNDEFRYMDIILPIDLDSRIPFQLYVDNLDVVNAHDISFIGETYIV